MAWNIGKHNPSLHRKCKGKRTAPSCQVSEAIVAACFIVTTKVPQSTGDVEQEKALQCSEDHPSQVCFCCYVYHIIAPAAQTPTSSHGGSYIFKRSRKVKAVHAHDSSRKFPTLSGAPSPCSMLNVNSKAWPGGTSEQTLWLSQLNGNVTPESFAHNDLNSRRVAESSCPVATVVVRRLVPFARKPTLEVHAAMAHVFKNVLVTFKNCHFAHNYGNVGVSRVSFPSSRFLILDFTLAWKPEGLGIRPQMSSQDLVQTQQFRKKTQIIYYMTTPHFALVLSE